MAFDKWKQIVGLDKVLNDPEEQVSADDAIAFARKIMESDDKRKVTTDV